MWCASVFLAVQQSCVAVLDTVVDFLMCLLFEQRLESNGTAYKGQKQPARKKSVQAVFISIYWLSEISTQSAPEPS